MAVGETGTMSERSPRASQFLASLQRRPAVTDVALVRSAFASEGIDIPDVWLDYHTRYAGLVIDLGASELAVLGIAHHRAKHIGRARYAGLYYDWDDERPQGGWLNVASADAHPSFDFWLTGSGQFLGSGCGGGADAFDTKIEQWAIWSLSGIDKTWTVQWLKGDVATALAAHEELATSLVREASDSQSTMYAGDGFVIQLWSDGSAHLVAQRHAPSWLDSFRSAEGR